MISAEPCFGNSPEAAVLGDRLRIEMTVVVDDRQAFGMVVVELDRRIVREHEIGSDKRIHVLFDFFVCTQK